MRSYGKYNERNEKGIADLKSAGRKAFKEYSSIPFSDSEIDEIQDGTIEHYGFTGDPREKGEYINRILDRADGASELSYFRRKKRGDKGVGLPERWSEFTRSQKVDYLDEAGESDEIERERDAIIKTGKSEFAKQFGERIAKAESLSDDDFYRLLNEIRRFR